MSHGQYPLHSSLTMALYGPQVGKHSAPSFSALPLGAFAGGTLALAASGLAPALVLLVVVAIMAIVLGAVGGPSSIVEPCVVS